MDEQGLQRLHFGKGNYKAFYSIHALNGIILDVIKIKSGKYLEKSIKMLFQNDDGSLLLHRGPGKISFSSLNGVDSYHNTRVCEQKHQ